MLEHRESSRRFSGSTDQLKGLFQRNPDMLPMMKQFLQMMPGLADVIETAEAEMLEDAIATRNPRYMKNRELALAMYIRLGFTSCRDMVVEDILGS